MYAPSEGIAPRHFGAPTRDWAARVLAPAALAVLIGALVGTDVRLGALLCLSLVAPVLVWARPEVALSLLCVCLGLNIDVLTVPVFVSLPQFLGLAMIGAVSLRHRSAGESAVASGVRPRVSALWAWGGFAFLLASVPSLVGAVSAKAALSGMLQLIAVSAVLLAGFRWFRRVPNLVDRALQLLVLGGILSVLVAVSQVVFDIGPPAFRAGGVMRAYSTYGQPNSYGMYLVGVAPLAFALRKHPGLMLPAFLALVGGIALTGSRGAWIAGVAGLATYLALLARPRMSTVLKGAAVLAVVPLVLLLVPREFILSRFDFTDWSTQQRLLLLFTAWQGILQSPITGFGPGSFQYVLETIAPAALVDDVAMPHNMILHVWFELGLAALICFCLLIGAYYIAAIRAFLRTRDSRIAALLAGVTAMLVGSMFGSLFIRGVEELFVVMVALTGVLVVGAIKETQTPEEPHARPVPL